MPDQDLTDQLQGQLNDAVKQRQPLEIIGGHSKKFYGRDSGLKQVPLTTSGHCGVTNYQPTELVITARAGTSIKALNQLLSDNNQMLPFEPPDFNGKATLGGTLACAMSGPARPYAGSARDFVLGTHIINGKGELLRLGGEVIKNVAGYDVSRLMVGAMGTLGVILQASLKVLPSSRKTITLTFELERTEAITLMNSLASRSLPITATCFYQDRLYIRLSGSTSGVDSAIQTIGGEPLDSGDEFWCSLREFEHPFFETDTPIWRISLPAMAIPELKGETLLEWNGTQWWLRSTDTVESIRSKVAGAGGHATLFKGGDRKGQVFHPLAPVMQQLQHRIKLSFDPFQILNRGRLTEFCE